MLKPGLKVHGSIIDRIHVLATPLNTELRSVVLRSSWPIACRAQLL